MARTNGKKAAVSKSTGRRKISSFSKMISDMAVRASLARRMRCSETYLWMIATGRRRASPGFSRNLEKYTGIAAATFRPDLWEKP